MLNLPLISIRRPVFALMLNVALVVLGLVSLTRLNVDLNPDVEFPFVTVTTILEGASPETVETEVTDVLEEQINTIEGIRELSSVSSEGISQIFVEFETGYDVNVKAQHVREKMAPVRAELPLDIEDPVVTQIDPDATPILSVMLGGPISVRELSELAENMVKDRLERLPGVGSIEIIGSRRREVRIWLDPVRLAGYGLSIDDVRSTLLLENAETAGGRVEGREREWTVTTSGRVKRVEDFGALIAAQRGGRLVYLRDVVKIEDGLAEERSMARFNGQHGVSLEVRRRSGANTVAVAEGVRAEVEALRPNLPPGMQVLITRDMAVFIEDSIYSVFSNMLWGGVLVVAVVLLFLRNPRSTLISALAIPSSVIASFTFFYVADFTLNVMTLMALSLSIGVVIDDRDRCTRGDLPPDRAGAGAKRGSRGGRQPGDAGGHLDHAGPVRGLRADRLHVRHGWPVVLRVRHGDGDRRLRVEPLRPDPDAHARQPCADDAPGKRPGEPRPGLGSRRPRPLLQGGFAARPRPQGAHPGRGGGGNGRRSPGRHPRSRSICS